MVILLDYLVGERPNRSEIILDGIETYLSPGHSGVWSGLHTPVTQARGRTDVVEVFNPRSPQQMGHWTTAGAVGS